MKNKDLRLICLAIPVIVSLAAMTYVAHQISRGDEVIIEIAQVEIDID